MSSTTFRRLLSASASLLTALVALTVSAAPLELASLKGGKPSVPPLRSAAPAAISAASVAAGLFRVNTAHVRQNMTGYNESVLFDDAARARAHEAELKSNDAAAFRRSDTCFATPGTFRVPEQHDPRLLEWDTFSADRFTAQSFPGDNAPRVVPVRAERWVEVSGKVSVKTTEFWVDVRSGGTRLIAQSEAELSKVASPFAGVSVFAVRTAEDAVAFYVRRDIPTNPASPNDDPLALLGGVSFVRSKRDLFDINTFRTTLEDDTHTSSCAFERVDLEVWPEPLLAPEVAVKVGTKSGLRKKTERRFNPFLARRHPPEFASVVFATVLALEPEPEPAEAGAEEKAKSPFRVERHGTVQLRTMIVNLGLARSSSGQEPVPSLSYRWLDRQRTGAF